MGGWNTHPIQAIFYSSATFQEETPSWRGAERRGHPEKMNAGLDRHALPALAKTTEGVALAGFLPTHFGREPINLISGAIAVVRSVLTIRTYA
ncbi:MAG: hypothetical protein ACK5UY_04795 [Holosporales bacterium]